MYLYVYMASRVERLNSISEVRAPQIRLANSKRICLPRVYDQSHKIPI